MSDSLDREFGGERLRRQIRFLVEMDRLKNIVRRTYLIGVDRAENSAEHSWHLALAALLLADESNVPIDVCHVIEMLLVHDIIEIDAGDTYAYDPTAMLGKAEREIRAAERIFGLLPADQAAQLQALWDEFEAGSTPEALFANAVDRLIPLLHNYYNHGRSWLEHGVIREQVMLRNLHVGEASTSLAAFVHEVIDDAVARGFLAPARGDEA